jgi:diphthine-ammonia ligase
LAYLWKYPILPPGTQSSLLEDMQAVGLDARIVKVASGGLDESFLWENVTNQQVMRRIERSTKRFGTYGDGAVLGEGGEFETLVVDGPASLFKGRIEVQERSKRVVREGGGSSWLQISDAKVVAKDLVEDVKTGCRIPDLLEPRFNDIFNALITEPEDITIPTLDSLRAPLPERNNMQEPVLLPRSPRQDNVLHWTVTASGNPTKHSITDEVGKLIEELRQRLQEASSDPTNIISTIIILRSMQDFASVNKVLPTRFPLTVPTLSNTTLGLRRPLHRTKSSSKSDNSMRLSHAQRRKYNPSPETPKTLSFLTR